MAIETMDVVDQRKRSEMMSRIRSRDTMPEIKVRRIAHAMGLRFRLHRRDLPGSPDLVFPRRHLVLFVHGCFWHRHPHCHFAAVPKTRVEFWSTKFRNNVERDRRVSEQLIRLGWRVAVIWECQADDIGAVQRLIREALDMPIPNGR